jgi:hypothetical protein
MVLEDRCMVLVLEDRLGGMTLGSEGEAGEGAKGEKAEAGTKGSSAEGGAGEASAEEGSSGRDFAKEQKLGLHYPNCWGLKYCHCDDDRKERERREERRKERAGRPGAGSPRDSDDSSQTGGD